MPSVVINVPFEKHRAEVRQLRLDIQKLVSRARLALCQNEPGSIHGQPQGAKHDRELEFDSFFERRAWYHVEIKRMRQDMEKRERAASALFERLGRDPMEVCNLVAERKRELQGMLRIGEGLDRVRRSQRKAEAAQNALRPEVARCLTRTQSALENQKRRHATLQSQRNVAISARKVAIDELRTACEEVQRKSVLLQRQAPRPGLELHEEERLVRYLQSNVDILKEAVKQDEKKFQVAQRAELREAENAQRELAKMAQTIADHEANLVELHKQIERLSQESSPKAKRPFTVVKPQADLSDSQGPEHLSGAVLVSEDAQGATSAVEPEASQVELRCAVVALTISPRELLSSDHMAIPAASMMPCDQIREVACNELVS